MRQWSGARVQRRARLGTSFGLPNPGFLPTKREWDEQRALVEDAVWRLKKRGVKAQGHVLATRKTTKRIVSEAERLGCGVIVMAADEPRNRFLADLMWSQESLPGEAPRVCARAPRHGRRRASAGALTSTPSASRQRTCLDGTRSSRQAS